MISLNQHVATMFKGLGHKNWAKILPKAVMDAISSFFKLSKTFFCLEQVFTDHLLPEV